MFFDFFWYSFKQWLWYMDLSLKILRSLYEYQQFQSRLRSIDWSERTRQEVEVLPGTLEMAQIIAQKFDIPMQLLRPIAVEGSATVLPEFDGLKIEVVNQIGYRHCWHCGAQVEINQISCPKCSNPVRKPAVADLVHFVDIDPATGEGNHNCKVAFITKLWQQSVVSLMLLSGQEVVQVGWCLHSQPIGNSWHYAEDC